uniref:Peptidase S9A N-terminal domain-containing protein n=1 Tax=Romanomermis culicivorax TaxID=13658 RepID=A0A915JYI0_ROMCU
MPLLEPEEADILKVVEAYCTSAAPPTIKGASQRKESESPHLLIAEDEKLLIEDWVEDELVIKEKTLVDTVYSLKDEVNEIKQDFKKMMTLFEEERAARLKTDELLRKLLQSNLPKASNLDNRQGTPLNGANISVRKSDDNTPICFFCLIKSTITGVSSNDEGFMRSLRLGFNLGVRVMKTAGKLLVPATNYPLADRDEAKIDNYHGTKICNPYHWLEDPDSPRTQDYVTKLNLVSESYFEQCHIRSQIRDELKKFLDYPKYSCPRKEGDYYFFSHNTGLQNQSVLYKQKTLSSEPVVFLDPNLLSEDGTTSIAMKSFTEDGSIMAYGLSEKGSDWVTVKFKRTSDGSDLPDKIEKLRYSSLCFTRDNAGVFYNRFPETLNNAEGRNANKNEYHRLYFHYLGTDQSEDVLCVEFPNNPNYMM